MSLIAVGEPSRMMKMINDNFKPTISPPIPSKPEEPRNNKPQPDHRVNEIARAENSKIHDPKLIGILSRQVVEEITQKRIEQAKLRVERAQFDMEKVALAILRSENIFEK